MENKLLTPEQKAVLLKQLKLRFENNMNRHKNTDWNSVLLKLENNPEKLWSLSEMERTGGEPDIVEINENADEMLFIDCSDESPKNRRSLCYDDEALHSRKEYKPANSAVNMAKDMGIELLSEEIYRKFQETGEYDIKTSSWILTPAEIRKHGGAIFCDRRYNHVFTYHNGAESYYAVRGFRGILQL